jgi:hypothetical protein
LLAALKHQTADLDNVTEDGNTWRDDEKLGNLVAQVYTSAADARTAMTALNAFSRRWGKKTRVVTRDEEIDGLGDEATSKPRSSIDVLAFDAATCGDRVVSVWSRAVATRSGGEALLAGGLAVMCGDVALAFSPSPRLVSSRAFHD